MNKFLQKAKDFYKKHKITLATISASISGLALAPFASADLTSTVSSSNGTFLSTTGFSYSDVVTKVGTWIKQLMGGGLGLVDAVIGWIIALIIFAIIVAILYKAMRFLHILR